jgi:Family of unknown function (DUF6760)
VAYHFHWAEETVLSLDHGDRLRWVKEISAINERRNNERNNESNAQPIFS